MIFVTELHIYAEKSAEADKLRSQWQYPPGIKVLGEYWLTGTRRVIVIAEASDITAIMQAVMPWAPLGDVTVSPAITAEEGLKLMAQMAGPPA